VWLDCDLFPFRWRKNADFKYLYRGKVSAVGIAVTRGWRFILMPAVQTVIEKAVHWFRMEIDVIAFHANDMVLLPMEKGI
jgi:hypothetical protein